MAWQFTHSFDNSFHSFLPSSLPLPSTDDNILPTVRPYRAPIFSFICPPLSLPVRCLFFAFFFRRSRFDTILKTCCSFSYPPTDLDLDLFTCSLLSFLPYFPSATRLSVAHWARAVPCRSSLPLPCSGPIAPGPDTPFDLASSIPSNF